MSVAVRRPMTVQAFLDWENQQADRWEFDGFQPVAMTGGTGNHARVQRNLLLAVGSRLRGKSCEIFGSDLKVVMTGSVRYPDAFVTCTPVAGSATHVTEPVIIFEVLSPSTARVDRLTKSQEYRDTPSIQRYVMLEQDAQAATVFSKANGDWIGHLIIGDTDLPLPEIGLSIPMTEIYEGVELVSDPAEDGLPTDIPRPAPDP